MLVVLRDPLESGLITIRRVARQADFPASFQLLAAMNPCFAAIWGTTTINAVARQIMCCATMPKFLALC